MGYAKTAFIIAATAIAVQLYPVFFGARLSYEFHGNVEPGFEDVEQVFRQNFENNWVFEGAAFAVCHKGKMVVDLWGGFADSTSHRLWKEDTMAILFSTTKAASAVSLALLVDRGLIKYDDLVTKYWPEFGQNGKEKITVKMLASHQAGLAVLDEQITYDVINDWKRMSAAFEKQKPNWEVGKSAGYHAFTIGWLIDQLIRRVDEKHRSLGQFFHEEIAKPNGIDLYIGLPMELEYRVARSIMPRFKDIFAHLFDVQFLKTMYSMLTAGADSLFSKIQKNPTWLSELNQGTLYFNRPDFHAIEAGAVNGISTARALAQIFCLYDSGKLFSKSTLERIIKPVLVEETDLVLRVNMTWGHGFIHSKNPEGKYMIGHNGYGGQNVKYDPNYGLGFGYIRNGLGLDLKDNWDYTALERTVYDVVKKLK